MAFLKWKKMYKKYKKTMWINATIVKNNEFNTSQAFQMGLSKKLI
jgi:hypothetical protein